MNNLKLAILTCLIMLFPGYAQAFGVTISAPLAGYVVTATPAISFTAAGAVSTQVKIDGAIVTKNSGDLLDPLAEGAHTLRVEATDSGGTVASSEVTFFVDTIAPSPPLAAKLSASNYQILSISKQGTLSSWGSNANGQLGDGTTITRIVPTQIGTPKSWSVVASGYYHSLAIDSAGSLWSWGSNNYGQLGNGGTSQSNSPVSIGSGQSWSAVAAGQSHSLAIRSDGTLWGWGYNSYGQLGDGSSARKYVPVQIGTDTDWKAVSAGGYHTIALKNNGTLWEWGDIGNENSLYSPVQIGSDTNWSSISAGYSHSTGIRSDGSLWAWGSNGSGQLGDGSTSFQSSPVKIGNDTDWNSVSAGMYHTVASKSSGTLWAWGDNYYGQLGDGTTTQQKAPTQIGTASDWQSVAGSGYSSYAIKSDGSLWAWGDNRNGQLGDGSQSNSSSPVSVTRSQGMIINNDATMTSLSAVTLRFSVTDLSGITEMRFSNDGFGGDSTTWATPVPYSNPFTGWTLSTGDGTKTVSVRFKDSAGNWSASFSDSITLDTTPPAISITSPAVGTTDDNTPLLSFSGAEGTAVVKVDGSVVSKISGDSLDVLDNGIHTVRVESADTLGNLGVAEVTFTVAATPPTVSISSPTTILSSNRTPQLLYSVSGGTVVVKLDGLVVNKISGDNLVALADGQHLLRIDATDVSGNVGYASVAFSIDATAPVPAPAVLQSVAGNSHSLVLKSDGTLWGWGYNNNGLLGVANINNYIVTQQQVVSASDWKSIGGGQSYTMAVKTDGTLWSWGNNGYGQLGDGSYVSTATPVQIGSDTNWVSVAAGSSFSIGLKIDGTLWSWGYKLGDGSGTSQNSPAQVGSATDWASVAAGSEHVLAIKTDGTLWSWGFNYYGQLGNGSITGQSTLLQIGSDTTWLSVAAGAYHSLALKKDGSLWAWGYNSNGQLGDGTTTNGMAPVRIGNDLDWKRIAGGSYHSMAVKNNGTLWAWGYNSNGQFGNGTYTQNNTPVRIGDEFVWADVTAGYYHSLGIKSNGSLWSWGYNYSGQLGNGTSSGTYPTPAQVTAPFGVLINTGASATATTDETKPLDVTISLDAHDASGVAEMRFSNDNLSWTDPETYAVTKSWQLPSGTGLKSVYVKFKDAVGNWSQAYSDSIEIIKLVPIDVSITSPAAGLTKNKSPLLNFTFASGMAVVKVDGKSVKKGSGNNLDALADGEHTIRVEAWNDVGVLAGSAQVIITVDTTAPVVTLTPLAAISNNSTPQISFTVSDGSVAVKVDGVTVVKSSGDTLTALVDGRHLLRVEATDTAGNTGFAEQQFTIDTKAPATDGPVQLSAGVYHSFERKSDGTLWGWGYNFYGQLGDGSSSDRSTPVQVGGNTPWRSVATGRDHTLAIQSDGTLWAWGYNGYGQLGDGTTSNRNEVPKQVGTYTDWIAITAGQYHSVGLRGDGTLWAWGYNVNGQLGDTTTTNRNVPVQVGVDTDWDSIAAGYNHTLALKKNGTLWAWGYNSNGQLGEGTNQNRLAPVQIGSDTIWTKITGGGRHSLAVKNNGTLWSWGYNGYGQFGNASNSDSWSPVKVGTEETWSTVAAGEFNSLALRTDGSAWVWGNNGNYYLFGDGTQNSSNVPVKIGTDSNWTVLAGGYYHSLGGRSDGSVWAWGSNGFGQVGDGTTTLRTTPTQVVKISGIVIADNVAATKSLMVPLGLTASDPSGIAEMRFSNDGTTWTAAPVPYSLTYPSWTLSDGDGTKTVYARFKDNAGNWSDSFSDTIILDTTPPAISITAPVTGTTADNTPLLTFTAAEGTPVVKVDGVVVAKVSGDSLDVLDNGSHTIRVESSDVLGNVGFAEVVLTVTASAPTVSISLPITAVGKDKTPPLTYTTSSDSISTKVMVDGVVVAKVFGDLLDSLADGEHLLRIEASDATGNIGYAVVTFTVDATPPALTLAVAQVSSGTFHTVAVRSDGTLWSWGFNGHGELGDGTWSSRTTPGQIGTGSDWKSTTAGYSFSFALKGDGSLWGWGYNGNGELGDGSATSQLSPVQVGSNAVWATVTAGNNHSLAIKRDGTLWSWGSNYYGSLGDGSTSDRTSPVQVGTTNDWSAIAAGSSHSLAIRQDGTLWAWGYNANSELGDGGTTNRSTPVQIGTDKDWKSVAAGDSHSLAIKQDGSLWAWGSNSYGQLGDGTTSDHSTPVKIGTATNWISVDAGGSHSIAVRQDGTLWAWGSNSYGQLGDATTSNRNAPLQIGTATDWALVSTAFRHSSALKSEGSLWTWGYNGDGEMGDGTSTDRYIPTAIQLPVDSTSFRRLQLVNNGANATDSSTVILSFNATDLHGVTEMQFSNDAVTWSDPEAYAAGKTWTLSTGDGEKTVYVRFKDTPGNWSDPYFDTIILDTSLPSITITAPNGSVNVNTPLLDFTASEGLVLVKIDGVVVGAKSGDTLGPLNDGSHLLRIETIDLAGHTAFAEATFTIDAPPLTSASVACTLDTEGLCSTAPVITLTTAFSSSAYTSYSLDGTTWQNYTGPFSITADGQYTVSFRSTDPGGLVETPAKTVTVKVNMAGIIGLWHFDNDWNDSSLLARNATPQNGPTFSTIAKLGSHAGNFDGVSSYLDVVANLPEYNFTIEAWAKTATQGGVFSVTGGGHDRHMYVDSGGFACFRVYSVYNANGWCTTTKVNDNFWHHWALVVQTGVGQKVYIDGQLAGENSYDHSDFNWQTNLNIGYSGDGGYFNGLIDDVTIYNRPLSAAEIVDYFNTYALDPPVVATPPAVVTNSQLTLSGTKPAATGIQINGITVVALDDSTTWQAVVTLVPGDNAIGIRVTDALKLSRIVTVNVAYDTTAPTVTGSVPANNSASKSAISSVAITVADAYSDLDLAATIKNATVIDSITSASFGGSWSSSGSGKSGTVMFTPTTPFSEGSYTVTINPTDINAFTQPATINFSVDNVPPAAPAFNSQQQLVHVHEIYLNGTRSSDTVQITVSAPDASTNTPTYPTATTWQVYIYNLKEGANTVTALAFDAAGNQSQPATLVVQVDTIAPANPSVNSVTTPTKNTTTTLTGTKVAGSYLYVNNGLIASVAAADTNWSALLNLNEGTNNFGIAVRDDAGNQSSTVSVSVVRDNMAPVIASSVPANNSVVASAASVSINLIDVSSEADITNSLGGAVMKDASGAVVAGTWSKVLTAIVFVPAQQPLPEGVYTATLYPMDVLGNKGSVSMSFIVDRASPTVTGFVMNPPSPHKAETVAFTLTFSEQMDTGVQPGVSFTRGLFYSTSTVSGSWVDGKTWQGSYAFTTSSGDGTYTVKVTAARDKAHNTMTDQEVGTFVVDTTAPDAPTMNSVTSPTKVVTQVINGTKPASTAVIINGVQRVPLSTVTDWSYSYPLAEGENVITVVARDEAGNDSAAVAPAPKIVLDTTPPLFTIDTFQNPTTTATQTIVGKREPGSLIKLNGNTIVAATDLTGVWSYAVTLTEGITNHLVFSATDAMGNLTTRTVDILYDVSAPAPLSAGGVVADGGGRGTEVTLTWSSYPEPPDLAYYRIYHSTANFSTVAGMTPVGTVTKGIRTFKAGSLITGTPYYFAVVPVDQSGNADPAVNPSQATPVDSMAPEDVTALASSSGYSSADGNTIALSWTASINSSGDLADQIIYQDIGSGYDGGTSLGKGATSFVSKNLNDATLYKFKITTKDSGGRESSGSAIQAVTRLANPATVTTTPGNGKVTISWTPVNSPYLKSYNVYRLRSDVQQTDISAMSLVRSQAGTSWSDSGLTNGTSYQYAVTVMNNYGAERTSAQSVPGTPRGDVTGPVITPGLAANQVMSAPVIISATALDAESAMGRMLIYIDGVVVKTQTGDAVSYSWNVVDTTDGPHTVKIAAFDSLDNLTELSLPVMVSLAPPAVPVITTAFGAAIKLTSVDISGTAAANSTVTLRVNGVVTGLPVSATGAGTFSFSGVPLTEGDNLLAVKAANRGGESTFSPDLKIIVDTGPPPAPTTLSAKPLAGGVIQVTWQQGVGEIPTGYNLYESATSFSSPSQAGVTRVNTAPLVNLLTERIPADDTLRYYGVTALDGAGNESLLSTIISIAADRTAPTVSDVRFMLSSGVPTGDGVYGPGTVKVTFTLSEALKEAPFFSLEPKVGSPIVVSAYPFDLTHYEGTFTIDANSPQGTTTYKFSGKDLVGNRGSSTGIGPVIDARGPAATLVAPRRGIKTTGGAVTVSVSLDEPSVITPALELRPTAGTAVAVTGLVSTDNGTSWNGTLDPVSLAEGTGQFYLIAAQDRFGNTVASARVGTSLVLYATTPPAPSVPTGLTAKGNKDGNIQLTWTKSMEAAEYRLYRRTSTTEAAVIASITDSAAVTFTDRPDTDGTYLYSISMIGLLASESARSAEISAVSDRVAPPVPSGMQLTLTSNGVNAAWQTPLAGDEIPVLYRLYRSADGVFTDLTTVETVSEVKKSPATDAVPTSTKHFYAITAIDAVGNESAPSTAQEIVFPVTPVRNMVLSRVDNGKPSLSWEAGETSLQGYHIYRNGSRITQTPTISTSYSDGYYSGGTVTYGVSSINAAGTESPIKEATLPVLSIALQDGVVLHRGVLETVHVVAALPADSPTGLELDSISLKIGSLPESKLPGPFTVNKGESRQIAKVAATESLAPPQVAVITTATLKPDPGTTIKITKSSLATVLSSGTALEIYNDPLKSGSIGHAKLRVNNLGSAVSEFLASENNGPTQQVTISLKDQDGNIISEGHLHQQTGAVVNNGSYSVVRIEPGGTFLSDPIEFAVPENAPDKVVIEARIDTVWYAYNQTEQVTAPGLKQSINSTIVDVAYTATAQSDKSVYKQGESILITGRALASGTGNPVASASVKVGISVQGFDRYYTVTTDLSGSFSYSFTPASNESGTYSFWATHPDLSDRTVQGQFSVIGFSVSPDVAYLRMLNNTSLDVPITLKNLSSVELTGLSFNVTTTGGITAETINSGDNKLTGGENQTIVLRLNPLAGATDAASANLTITTAEGISENVTVNVMLMTAIPIITTSPSYIDSGVVRGFQKIATFKIENTGIETLKNPRIEGPSLSWVSLTIDRNPGDIPAGQNLSVGLMLKPGDTVPQGVYDDRLTIYSDNHIPYTYNIQVTVSSSAVGNVQFSVLSELMKDVADATVTIQSQTQLNLVYTLKTAADGSVTFFDIPEGRYSYNISAPGTSPTSGSFVVDPGITITVPIALEVKLVTLEWSVTPVVIEDRYDIKLTQVFATNVPTPVLISEPPSITLPNLQPGQVFNGEYTVTNYGLIAADNVTIDFPTSAGDYDIEVLVSAIPKQLKAMQKIKIPYRITRRSVVAGNYGLGVAPHASMMEEVSGFGGGNCFSMIKIKLKSTYIICPNTPQQKTGEWVTYHYVTDYSTSASCSSSDSSVGPGWSSLNIPGGQTDGGFTPSVVTPLPSVNPCDCKPDGTPCPPPAGGGSCMGAECQGGSCVPKPLPDGSECDDNKLCTSFTGRSMRMDRCKSGSCEGKKIEDKKIDEYIESAKYSKAISLFDKVTKMMSFGPCELKKPSIKYEYRHSTIKRCCEGMGMRDGEKETEDIAIDLPGVECPIYPPPVPPIKIPGIPTLKFGVYGAVAFTGQVSWIRDIVDPCGNTCFDKYELYLKVKASLVGKVEVFDEKLLSIKAAGSAEGGIKISYDNCTDKWGLGGCVGPISVEVKATVVGYVDFTGTHEFQGTKLCYP
ncbi:MAG: LamG-like jellyroll fold domain-containing protein [Desulfuromonadaceae bacterium]